MIILSIETSCDETAISVVEADGGLKNPSFRILGNNVASQVEIHREYGGVFPMMAKREHAKNLIPLLEKTLRESNFLKKLKNIRTEEPRREASFQRGKLKNLETILKREPELLERFLEFIPSIEKPSIDLITVTYGPGLEPALWVGLNFAKALSLAWDVPLVPTNHMEGHILSALLPEAKERRGIPNFKFLISKLFKRKTLRQWEQIRKIEFPALALLISGGHTELVLMKDWLSYEILGETLDDAVGEAFDKVARMLGFPYPGGPQISHLAQKAKGGTVLPLAKKSNLWYNAKGRTVPPLPKPMIDSGDYNFSFSGLKTAVLYLLKKIPKNELTEDVKAAIAKEFQDAVTEVLVTKTMRAVEEYDIKTLLIGGGVAANTQIQAALGTVPTRIGGTVPTKLNVYFPRRELSTDNSVMIAMAGYMRALKARTEEQKNRRTEEQKNRKTPKESKFPTGQAEELTTGPAPHIRACGTLRLK